MWGVLFSDGALHLDHMEQIKSEKWVPLAASKPKNSDIPGTILLFAGPENAYRFTKDNISIFKGWVKGGIQLSNEDVLNIRKKFDIEVVNHPKKFTTHPRLTLSYEVVELTESPTLNYVQTNLE